MLGFFSDTFGVPEQTLADYGALDVSLVADLPLFIDPFLLFTSPKPEYQQLHSEIVKYLKFLKAKSDAGKITKGSLREWYCFKEVKQNWMGYCELGNNGAGLGIEFAHSLNRNLAFILHDFGKEVGTSGTHLEKVCLIKDGVGKDNVSDFATNLIKSYLLDFTQDFAVDHVPKEMLKTVVVDRARFDYNLEVWVRGTFTLPYFNGDFILLTPTDMLTKDENWINQKDMVERFRSIPAAVSDPQIRSQISNYFEKVLWEDVDDEPTSDDFREAALETVKKFPFLLDIYIKMKEDAGDQAMSVSDEKVLFAQLVFNHAVRGISELLPDGFYASPPVGTYDEAQERLRYLKHVIEDQGGHRFFYQGGKPIRREKDLHVLYRLVWFGTKLDFGAEADDGRGPVDFKISYGAKDKTLVEFKLASNTSLRINLKKQLPIYQLASDAPKGIKAIVYFTQEELDRVEKLVEELGMTGSPNIVFIDARSDNKPSGSKAR
ncbi:MAG: hypothetical protein KJ755_02990 [Alphaproteobacteria bacterium]|nr:hypothetical protein [Alphaproteobacteria bacterium]